MKPLVIYHADCTDGFGAAFAAWLKLGDEAEYLPMQYNAPGIPQDVFRDREVYILDFSFPKSVMDAFFHFAKRVVWLDHHKTAFEMWCETERTLWCEDDSQTPGRFILLDNNKSGALLAWEYFHPDTEVPMLIQHIDDRDRWVFALSGSKELHAALASIKPWSFEKWNGYQNGNNGLIEAAIEQGTAILRAQDAHVKSMLKQARKLYLPVWPEGHVVTKEDVAARHGLVLNTNMHMSEVGHELANQSSTFGLVWYLGADCRVKCSLRSNGEYDVSAIARAFGGGGHRNAAGFETDIETLMGWLK